eukprot:TRINITY_DN33651_c0_g1_i1.p1 TRINITY_DN33651_c0_g1~~TRINITY_DN33651_c0_g1_i1.p1  ORF type:complete len:237 (+),score=115.75 TRINITY_DN33651_c0_g1_i1:47-757(+)
MGGNQSSQPVGTDFNQTKKQRQKYQNIELPDIPFNKLKEIQAEVDMTVKSSTYLGEYKREFRGALKRKEKKGHDPKIMRLYDKSLHPADDAAGKDEDRKALIKLLTENITPVVKDDIIDGFKEDGREGDDKSFSKEADRVIYKLIHERVHDIIKDSADVIYKKYLKNEDIDVSDAEDDEEALAAKEEERAGRKREAAKQREYEQEAWLAEMNGEEPPPAPAADDDDEEEEEEEDEE